MCEVETAGELDVLSLYASCFWACTLWGAGTAVGEIPPSCSRGSPGSSAILNWMLDVLNGSASSRLLSAWPNAAFDLVGICCGASGWP